MAIASTGVSPAASPAASDLGLGDALSNQVRGETEEERRKRMQQAQQRQMLGPAAQMLGLTGGLGGTYGS